MRNIKIFSVAFLCAQSVYGNICNPKAGQPIIGGVIAPGQVENCANPSKPNILPANGQGTGTGAECSMNGGSQGGQLLPICNTSGGLQPNNNQNNTSGSVPQGGQTGQVIPAANQGGQFVPIAPIPANHSTGLLPFAPVAPVQPVINYVPVQPQPQPQAPAKITQIIQPPPPSATTIIQPTNQPTPAPSNPQPTQPPKQESQCKVKTNVECLPVTPEEEMPEAPQEPTPSGPTSVIVVPQPANPNSPNGQNECVNPSSSNNQNGGTPVACAIVGPSAPVAPTVSVIPGTPQNNSPSSSQNFVPGTAQNPSSSTVYVPMSNVQPSTPPSSNECTSPSSMINSLCDNSNLSGKAMKSQITSCDIPNNQECLSKMINSTPQPTPIDVAECTPSNKTLVDVGVLAPASEAYLQAHQNSCL